ncbi:glycosyltransferase family 4 protein [Peteryoungia ipomoeae]|uniref:Glycosyltransferase family 4 protein n=1 Tax=Peteryoungia ipomoeae TaxID=1210932 RepID=A0A4S8NW21_9HYPH|nr:glycosyltransferase family 4 protein [Peteryoungia ipomoeae]THV21041.1 glycosyltransferase family 4 protein [Peteryoungia ipomoeae]
MNRRLTFAYPGDLNLKTGGYAYDRELIAGLRALGWEIDLLALGDGFPSPSGETLRLAEEKLSSVSDGELLVIDGLAFGVLDGWAVANHDRLGIIALVHHPLALETGIAGDARDALLASERDALAVARHVVVTSNATAREVATLFGVDPTRITTALPGTKNGRPSTSNGIVPHILAVGTLIERKGHDILVDALKSIEHLEWRTSIVGSRTLDPVTSLSLEKRIAEHDLQSRITLCGEVEDTRSLMADADIFALASRYEGYGMVFAEALAQGLPIVACRAGAIPEVVPEEAGFLVAVDDVTAFAQALETLILDPKMRALKAEGSARAGQKLPGWEETAQAVSKLLETLK